jgi:two-component sensor histidine kinase
MVSGQSIRGQREWAVGVERLDMQTFAVRDPAGLIIAVASFEGYSEEPAGGAKMLIETAFLLLLSVGEPVDTVLYRELTPHDGIVIAEGSGKIISANAAARSIYRVLGISHIVGRRVYDRHLNMAVAHKASVAGQPQEAELEVSNVILRERAIPVWQNGQLVRTIIILADVTALREKEKELLVKAAVIQEIHHRVKNNLQTIASLLRLQARRTKSAEAKAALQESVNRILSISVVHEFLSQHDAEVINVAEIAQNILKLVVHNMVAPDLHIKTVFNGAAVILLPSDQATSLALVINELVQNSLEHAFDGQSTGVIGINITSLPDAYQIVVYDDGVGLNADFDAQTGTSLGLQIVRTLIETDLGGQFSLESNAGTRANIIIPRMKREG